MQSITYQPKPITRPSAPEASTPVNAKANPGNESIAIKSVITPQDEIDARDAQIKEALLWRANSMASPVQRLQSKSSGTSVHLKVSDVEKLVGSKFKIIKSLSLQGSDMPLTDAIIIFGEIHPMRAEIGNVVPGIFRPGDRFLVEATEEELVRYPRNFYYNLTDFGSGGCFAIDLPEARRQLHNAYEKRLELSQKAVEACNLLIPERALVEMECYKSDAGGRIPTSDQVEIWVNHLIHLNLAIESDHILLSLQQKAKFYEYFQPASQANLQFNLLFNETGLYREQEMYSQIISHAKKVKPGHNVVSILGGGHVAAIQDRLFNSGWKVLVLLQNPNFESPLERLNFRAFRTITTVTDVEKLFSNQFMIIKSSSLQGSDIPLTGVSVLIGQSHSLKENVGKVLSGIFWPGDHLLVETTKENLSRYLEEFYCGLSYFEAGEFFSIDHSATKKQLNNEFEKYSKVIQNTIEGVNALIPELALVEVQFYKNDTGERIATPDQVDIWVEHLTNLNLAIQRNQIPLSPQQKTGFFNHFQAASQAKTLFDFVVDKTMTVWEQQMYSQTISHADTIEPGHNVISILDRMHVERMQNSLLNSGRKVLVLLQKHQ